jgi:hypothetical protein
MKLSYRLGAPNALKRTGSDDALRYALHTSPFIR